MIVIDLEFDERKMNSVNEDLIIQFNNSTKIDKKVKEILSNPLVLLQYKPKDLTDELVGAILKKDIKFIEYININEDLLISLIEKGDIEVSSITKNIKYYQIFEKYFTKEVIFCMLKADFNEVFSRFSIQYRDIVNEFVRENPINLIFLNRYPDPEILFEAIKGTYDKLNDNKNTISIHEFIRHNNIRTDDVDTINKILEIEPNTIITFIQNNFNIEEYQWINAIKKDPTIIRYRKRCNYKLIKTAIDVGGINILRYVKEPKLIKLLFQWGILK